MRRSHLMVGTLAALFWTAGSASAASAAEVSSAGTLAATGFTATPWIIAAGVLVLFGIALFALNLYGRRREQREAENLADAASETPENTGADDSISRDGT